MSSSRYPDTNRYPRDRSPYRDRRPSTYTGGYPPRSNDGHGRQAADSVTFPPRDVPRGPKSLVDAPRGPPSGPSSGLPPGPRDGRGRGFGGRGDGAPSALRDAPPLSSGSHGPRDHAMRDQWRASDRDRDRDLRDRRLSPPRRSPIRDSRDFSLNIDRARRNSRDGPPSAGSTYSDPPLIGGSSYRGSGVGRGRGGGRDFGGDFRPRGRGYHNDERDRHHDPRDVRDRMYRPRSRSREPLRRDIRDERDFDRRERDDRRFERRDDEPRRYDSYQGSASANFKPSLRNLDTHRGSASNESRNLAGASAGPSTPHSAHHSGPGDRVGPLADHFSRRTSVATEPQSAKDTRRDDMIASRAEFSKERYGPRPSSPPASVPAFGVYGANGVLGTHNVWRNPALDSKPPPMIQTQKPVAPTPAAPLPTTAPVIAAPVSSTVPKPTIPAGLSTVPPTGPKADRLSERPQVDTTSQEHKPQNQEALRADSQSRAPAGPSAKPLASEGVDARPVHSASNLNSIPPALGSRNRAPPAGPQAALRPNASPSFSRAPPPAYPPRDASPGAIPVGPRNGLPITSPKSTPVTIPTGPKADRANSLSRPSGYGPPERPPFASPRMPPHKSNQWINPSRYNRPTPTIPAKREFPVDDRDRGVGASSKNARLDASVPAPDMQHSEPPKSETTSKPTPDEELPTSKQDGMKVAQVPKVSSPKPTAIETRRFSDISMPDISPRTERPSALSVAAVPTVMEDSDDDFDLDENDFAESEAKYNREKALLESKLVDLSATHLRATTPLQEIMLLLNVTVEHLPHKTLTISEEEPALPIPVEPPVQPPVEPNVESPTTELPTPREEALEDDDMDMSKKQEASMAPATRALRLRRQSLDRETTPPNLTALPYLVSGPPTPLSDLDHGQPPVPAPVLLAVRDSIRKDTEQEKPPEDALKQYADAYKQWRYRVQQLDHEGDHDDGERQPTAEPTLKASTPDITGSSVSGLPDTAQPTIGRRGRFATELDLALVIKESLKTAQQETSGKDDKEYEKVLWDPEREAVVPSAISAYEAQRRRFIDTNFQREPGQGIFVYHYEPPEDDFTPEEHQVMVQHYRDQYAKKWGKLAEILYKETGISRTYKDTINHYYATKWDREFKHKARRGGARRKAKSTRARGATAVDRSDHPGDDAHAALPLTDSGRPRRQAAPIFGADTEMDPTGITPSAGRQRRQVDVEGVQEKAPRRAKGTGGRRAGKTKAQPLAAAPAPSPVKVDRKEKALGVKAEEDPGKRQGELLPLPSHPPTFLEEIIGLQSDPAIPPGFVAGVVERPRSHTQSRVGPSSYWSVTEQTDFQRNVAHFGTDWAAIATHMGTKTTTMVKNHYNRLTENGTSPALAKAAEEADKKRERGEDLGAPPTPTPIPKRRYEPTQPGLPRVIAPTPDGGEVVKSPAAQAAVPPKFSPPQAPLGRFSTIAQAPPQISSMIPTGGSGSISETALAALPSLPRQHSPPQARLQGQNPQSQHKPHVPRAGYFPDEQPLRMESRMAPHSTSMAQTSHVVQQQIQPHVRAQETLQHQAFHNAHHPEREPQSRLDQQHEHDYQVRYQQHSRQLSRDIPHGRPFTPSASVSVQNIPSMRSSSVQTTEDRPMQLQPPRYMHSHGQPTNQPPPELVSHAPGSMAVPSHFGPRSGREALFVKDEQRHNSQNHPAHTQSSLQPLNQSSSYPQSMQRTNQAQPQPPTTTKAAPDPPKAKKSNLLSLLNDEPEEPARKKPLEAPSHTPTPRQQTPPIFKPPPAQNQAPSRRDIYGDAVSAHSSYTRTLYSQQPTQPQVSSVRQVVDLTNELPGTRHPPRAESWQQQRSSYHTGRSQTPQAVSLDSPRSSHAQSPYVEQKLQPSHRTIFAQHNGPRHNPSPPPSAFSNSPHMHSRTPSVSAPSQQSRQGLGGAPTAQNAQQPPPVTSQVLQPNPYKQADPPGTTPQPPPLVGIRGSPHHTSMAPSRELQSRNEQSQIHNGAIGLPNVQRGELQHAHRHSRGPSVHEQFGGRDPREYDHPHQDRDLSRERSQRPDPMRDPYMPGTAQPTQQDYRFQHPPPPDRGYIPQPRSQTPRSQTPLSRSEHPQASSQHVQSHPATHPLRTESVRLPFDQRHQEDTHPRYRDSYPMDERFREEQQQQAMAREGQLSREREMRVREMREMQDRQMQESRYREEMMRRDSRASGPPPSQQPQPHHGQHEARHSQAGLMDWAPTGPRQQQERWQQPHQPR